MSKKWRRIAVEVCLVLLAVTAVRAYQARSHLRGQIPRAVLTALDGKVVTLGEATDEPVVLHFWATWCGVCRLEEGNVVSLAKRVRVVSVASRSGSASEVERYVRHTGISYPVVNDPTGQLAQRYGVNAFPTTFFVGRDGVIATSETGYTTYLGLWLRAIWAAM